MARQPPQKGWCPVLLPKTRGHLQLPQYSRRASEILCVLRELWSSGKLRTVMVAIGFILLHLISMTSFCQDRYQFDVELASLKM
jgi:hypothetical protein